MTKAKPYVPPEDSLSHYIKEEIKKLKARRSLANKEERKANLRTFKQRQEIMQGELYGTRGYIITFKKHPEYAWVVFSNTKGKAYWAGVKETVEYYFPGVKRENYPLHYNEARGNIIPDFDPYVAVRKVPVNLLMKHGFTFKCCFCHDKVLTYEDYENGECFLFEGEEDAAPFATGNVVCKNCWNKMD